MKRLRNKVTVLFLFLAGSGILGTAFASIRFFAEDKREYVLELNSVAAPNIANSIGRHLLNLERQLAIIEELIRSKQSPQVMSRVFQDIHGAKQLDVFDGPRRKLNATSKGFSEITYSPEFVAALQMERGKFIQKAGEHLVFSTWIRSLHFMLWLSPHSIQQYFERTHAIDVLLISAHGNLILSSEKNNQDRLPASLSKDWIQSLKFQEKHSLIARQVTNSLGEKYLTAAAPVPNIPGLTLIVQAPDTQISEMVKQMTARAFPVVAMILGLATLLGFVFSKQLVQPIEELTQATSEIAAGHWQVRVKMSSENELGTLVKSFNHMGAELEKRETALEIAHQELLRSEKLASLGKFSAGIAHEVKNPLNSILGFAQLLRQRLKQTADENVEKFLGFIMDETRRASQIISDLLTFARQKPPHLVEKDMTELLNYVYEIFSPQAAEVGVRMEKEIPSETKFLVEMDRDQAFQVLSNLVGNAFHAMEEQEREKKVILSLSQKENWTIASVKDTGSGMPPETLAKIFEPFFSTKTVGKGTGLGLAMCHGIMQAHRGKIEVESHVGQGTVFKLYFPTKR